MAPLNGPGKWFGVETIVVEPGAENIGVLNLWSDIDAALIKVPNAELTVFFCLFNFKQFLHFTLLYITTQLVRWSRISYIKIYVTIQYI